MSPHQEIAFEDDICAHLAAHGWHYEQGDAQRYDRARALFPPDLIAWFQESQPAAWVSLTKTHGAATETVLLDRIRKQLDDRGTLDLLRHGVELLGLRKPLQLDATRRLLAAVLAQRPGGLYLVQHSAGSGKTNSIAWSAHFLADLHDADNRKLFDTVLVVSDRTVLDDQLAEAIFGFERTAVLSAQELAELADGGEVGTADLLAAQMTARAGAKESGITYIAFTATPKTKTKTLELFGRRPDPARPPGPDNLPAAFHVYSMRQAIEEGFILDVLRNYTPYQLAFRLAALGRERDVDEQDVVRDEALKGVLRWVRLHPYNIAQKVQVVVEHFRETVAPLLEGKAKAMVVVGSRVEAVRRQLATTRYIRDQGYAIGALVAFSGEVSDPESGPDSFTERSLTLNPALRGRDLREAFATDEYHLLLVANKFQTGFDQPLLCGMYVDKRLAGVQAVQTLSRLNRAYPGKDTTYILDFVNEPDEILAAFKPYYETAALSGVTDPNLVYDLRARLDAAGYYDDFEIERVVMVELDPRASQAQLSAALEPVADRLLKRFKAERGALEAAQARADTAAGQAARDAMNALVLFKRNLGAFLRVYAFLSQIFDYGNTAIEKRAIFYKRLLPLLEFGRVREGVDLSKLRLTHHGLQDQGQRNLPLAGGERLAPMTDPGGAEVREQERARLAEIIAAVNDLFAGALTDDDKLVYMNDVLKGKLLESATLVQQARNNTKEQFATSPRGRMRRPTSSIMLLS